MVTEGAFGDEHLEVARTLAVLGFLEYSLGNLDEAHQLFERVLEIRQGLFGPEHPALINTLYNLACLTALSGERDEALQLIGRAVELGYARPTIFTDADLDSLRGDPGFESLLTQVRSRLPVIDILVI
jgi:tetratricopeptide (TPR) repeat protein